MSTIVRTIAKELGVNENQVSASIELLDGGSTVPFIARYRKEVTGALDDTQLRTLEDRLRYLREFEDRKSAIVASIESQGKMTDDLRRAIDGADSKSQLEDLYLPYKPKRRTKGMIAIEAGLEPLADTLFQHPETDPHTEALNYLNAEHKIDDAQAALDGAKYILMERFSEHAEVLQTLKSVMWDKALIKSTVVAGQESTGQKFKDYFDYQEAINKVPSHRSLALFRGRTEGILNITLEHSDHDSSDRTQIHPCEGLIAKQFGIQYAGRVDQGTEHQDRAADAWLREVVKWTWRVKLSTHVETDLLSRLREAAEDTAISVFASNLKDLLLAAPAGPKVTIGLDPGLRTGVKVAVVDATGKVLDHTAIYPHAPKNQWDQSIEILAGLARKYRAELLSIGNGTASRETEKLAGDLSKRYPELKLSRIVVSEAGASVYSASEHAAQEFPDLDVTIRGAVSIARRLQDPLSELVKIEPKAIGVGQYQHDVSQVQLGRSLKSVVEDCVNSVGVDLNTASVPLLTHVSGLNQSIASNIVTYRETHGAFGNREQLRAVPRLGDKAFEQCAGFLRIANSDNPLDASAVHPESYALVDQIAARTGTKLSELIGNSAILKGLAANDFSHEDAGALTIQDILSELAKPGRDPRPEFKFASFKEGVESLSDLKPGMLLEGSVTNVTHFGAFVDIGVHQDGLVHISALANRFVKDPRDVVKTGDIVKVKVLEVEVDRKRIALTMKLDQDIDTAKKEQAPRRDAQKPRRSQHSQTAPAGNNAMAAAFAKLKQPS